VPERFLEILVARLRFEAEQESMHGASNPPSGAPDQRFAERDLILASNFMAFHFMESYRVGMGRSGAPLRRVFVTIEAGRVPAHTRCAAPQAY
jgi:hypothetical protein